MPTTTILRSTPRHQRPAVIEASMGQSASDIQKKIQKIEGFKGKKLSECMEIAQKTFNNRESEGDKKNLRNWQTLLLQLRGYIRGAGLRKPLNNKDKIK